MTHIKTPYGIKDLTTYDDAWMQKLWEWADKSGAPDLKRIERYGGYWMGLPRDKQRLMKITCLRLNATGLSELPKEIGKLTRLKELSLYKNELTELPKEIGALTNLTKLWLGDNAIVELPEEIGDLTALSTLNLRNNRLERLPKRITNLRNLVKIWLCGNSGLSWTQEQIEWISDLKNKGCLVEANSYSHKTQELKDDGMFIGLHTQEKEELDPSFLNLWKKGANKKAQSIEKVDEMEVPSITLNKEEYEEATCFSTQEDGVDTIYDYEEEQKDANWPKRLWAWADKEGIASNQIPREIAKLTSLTALDLRGKNITELPKEIGNLTSLKELSLLANNLTKLPEEIGDLINLTWLGLANNNLRELPDEIVNLINLTFLRLADNHNLVLTERQKYWIERLKEDGCRVSIDDDLFDRED